MPDRSAEQLDVAGFHRLGGLAGFPAVLARGAGAVVHDIDGVEYIDYVLGKGPVILGHCHPAVQRAAHLQIEHGNLFGLCPAAQLRAAERLRSIFPGDWGLRFHKTGSDACESAARIARAFTGRSWILSAGYHGWHDWCVTSNAGSAHQPAFADFRYDLSELERLFDRHRGDVAAIFVEPQPGFLAPGFYHELRAMADAAGCLLAFDEVKTGLRVVDFAVHRSTQTKVDLFTLSKAISNGFCLSCVLGRPDVMEAANAVHTAGTYDIEATPFAAATETLAILGNGDALARITATCRQLVDGMNAIFRRHDVAVKAFASDTLFRLGFAEADRERHFYAAMAERRILLYPYDNQFLSLAHGAEHVRRTLDAAEQVVQLGVRGISAQSSFAATATWGIHQFHHRKGYLRGAPGPYGR